MWKIKRSNSLLIKFLVYADASDACNQLNFQLGPTSIGTTIPSRSWNIKVNIENKILPPTRKKLQKIPNPGKCKFQFAFRYFKYVWYNK